MLKDWVLNDEIMFYVSIIHAIFFRGGGGGVIADSCRGGLYSFSMVREQSKKLAVLGSTTKKLAFLLQTHIKKGFFSGRTPPP